MLKQTIDTVDSVDYGAIVALLTQDSPPAVTFAQIEAAMELHGIDPNSNEALYSQLIVALEQRDMLVVESLSADDEYLDEEAEDVAIADEVLTLLASITKRTDLFRHELLSAGDERRLLEIFRNGKRAEAELLDYSSDVQYWALQQRIEAAQEALDHLVRHNIRLVAKCALRYSHVAQHMQLEDLLQEGLLGLVKAIERFDTSMELRLSTYASWWIRQSITRAMADQDQMIRWPVHVYETKKRIRNTHRALLATLDREPSEQELADALSMPLPKLRRLNGLAANLISLDMRIGTDEKTALSEMLLDHNEITVFDLASQKMLEETLEQLMEPLTEREQLVIRQRFGLDGSAGRTLEEIGRQLGLTRERVRQIEQKTLRKLRDSDMLDLLRDYV